ncbi:MAG: hypothetical protein R3E86_15885 [Pseudomonadales bacterium]
MNEAPLSTEAMIEVLTARQVLAVAAVPFGAGPLTSAIAILRVLVWGSGSIVTLVFVFRGFRERDG